jgi:4-amino-4-deoxy-L-arabinose transferase-like glycosyltransferase
VYLPTFLIGTMPWLAIAAATWWSRRRSGERVAALDPAASQFLLLWFALPFGVFVLSQSRLPFYVLPLFVPVSLALAASLGGSVTGRRAVIALGLAIVAAVSLKGGGTLLHRGEDADRLAVELRQKVDLATVETIVFVDSPARYGLKHYTGKTVEQAESYPGAIGPGGYVQAEALCHELATGQNHLLFVPTRQLDEIKDRLNECPRDLEQIGALRKWTLLRPAN